VDGLHVGNPQDVPANLVQVQAPRWTIRSYRSRSRGGCAGTGGRFVFEFVVVIETPRRECDLVPRSAGQPRRDSSNFEPQDLTRRWDTGRCGLERGHRLLLVHQGN
jgi:hypothetical protein